MRFSSSAIRNITLAARLGVACLASSSSANSQEYHRVAKPSADEIRQALASYLGAWLPSQLPGARRLVLNPQPATLWYNIEQRTDTMKAGHDTRLKNDSIKTIQWSRDDLRSLAGAMHATVASDAELLRCRSERPGVPCTWSPQGVAEVKIGDPVVRRDTALVFVSCSNVIEEPSRQIPGKPTLPARMRPVGASYVSRVVRLSDGWRVVEMRLIK